MQVEFAGFEDELVVQAEKFEAGDGEVEGDVNGLTGGDFKAAEVFEFQYGTDYRRTAPTVRFSVSGPSAPLRCQRTSPPRRRPAIVAACRRKNLTTRRLR